MSRFWPFEQTLRDEILQHITPDFRLDRDPSNPVAGNGRDSICFSKKLEVSVSHKLDKVGFMSVAVCTLFSWYLNKSLTPRLRLHISPPKLLKLSRDVKIGINGSYKVTNSAVSAISTTLDYNARQPWMSIVIRL